MKKGNLVIRSERALAFTYEVHCIYIVPQHVRWAELCLYADDLKAREEDCMDSATESQRPTVALRAVDRRRQIDVIDKLPPERKDVGRPLPTEWHRHIRSFQVLYGPNRVVDEPCCCWPLRSVTGDWDRQAGQPHSSPRIVRSLSTRPITVQTTHVQPFPTSSVEMTRKSAVSGTRLSAYSCGIIGWKWAALKVTVNSTVSTPALNASAYWISDATVVED